MTVYIVLWNEDILGVYAKLADAQSHVGLLINEPECVGQNLRIVSCGIRE